MAGIYLPPARKIWTPRPYQILMEEHIYEHPMCAIWAFMGAGKTGAVLMALQTLAMMEEVWPALVVGPLRVARDVWPEEPRKWSSMADLDVIPIVGDPKEREAALKRDAPIYSVNYENLPWLAEFLGDKWRFPTVVLDEATKMKGYRGSFQTSTTGKQFIRNAGSQRPRALAGVLRYIRRTIELSGTPAPNGLKDLWGQLWFLDGGQRLGRNFEGFKERWFAYNQFTREMKPTKTADEEIHAAVGDICMSLRASDWFDIKKPIVNNVYIDLPAAARRNYDEMAEEMFTQIAAEGVEAFNAAARTSKCLQLASGAVYVDPSVESDGNPKSKQWREVHDRKLEALESIVSEANGAPIMVSYSFRSDRARILKLFPKAVDLAETAGLKAFKQGKVQIGVCHPQSLGHGVDGLQNVCNRIAFFSRDWALESFDQLVERIGPVRQLQAGFDRPVYHSFIVARDTLDEDVAERHATKRSTQEILLDATNKYRRKHK